MEHPSNARLAAKLREHAARIENDEHELTQCSINLDLVHDDPHPSIVRNVDPSAPELFTPKPPSRFVN